MSATFTPYFEAQAHRDPAGSDAYIHVRVPGGPHPDGSILVYLPNGTGLVVNSNQLLHLDAGPNCPCQSDGRTLTAMGTYGHGRRHLRSGP
jgi:hypothetical protein